MPASYFTNIASHGAYLLWRIDESEEVLLCHNKLDTLAQRSYKVITHARKRSEWLAARLALRQLMDQVGHPYTTLHKDAWGQPHLINSPLHVSIAHCFPFVLVAVNRQPIGIDVQRICKQLQYVQAKFMRDDESAEHDHDIVQLCIYWCAKEAIYKAYGGKGLSLKNDIRIYTFLKAERGTVFGGTKHRLFKVDYQLYKNHVLTWSSEVSSIT